MEKELNVPKELKGTFNRLTRKIPAKFRNDDAVRKTTFVFLRLGGEKLAKAMIEGFRVPFTEKFILKKMQIKDTDLIEKPAVKKASPTGAGVETTGAPDIEKENPQ